MSAYSHAETPISNQTLYRSIIKKLALPEEILIDKTPVGKECVAYNLFSRKVRWFQQSLKQAGILEKVAGKRGEWCLVKTKNGDLDKILPALSVVGFSTRLGVAILGYSEHVFSKLNEPINLIITSPPYPLGNPRKYGNVKESEYVDWICATLEPVIQNLVPGGVIAINVGNDVFLTGTPARSMYKERLLLALSDRFALSLMDTLIWHSANKAPGPIAWASKKRMQLNVAWEPVYYLTNDPLKVIANNQRVLQPHTEKHLDFIVTGGAKKRESKSDGAYTLKEGSYSNQTAGKIARNVLSIGNTCSDNRKYKKDAISQGFIPHGATMPLKLASFLIEFMSRPQDLVVDPFAGSFTTARAAETLNRRWIGVDPVADYVAGAALRFNECNGFQQNSYSH